jgi:membrane protein DedA with SNARE-associated domain
MHGYFSDLIHHYGYAGIYGSLVLGIVGVPVPDEILMLFCGFLVSKGELRYFPTLITAFCGSISGMSVAYFVAYMLESYLKRKKKALVDKIAGVSSWFQKYGKFAIIIGYFIPGIRYVTAYFSGMSEIRYRQFITYAACGAAVWTTTFITAGLYLGKQWKKYSHLIYHYSEIFIVLLIAAVLIFIAYTIVKKKKKKINEKNK